MTNSGKDRSVKVAGNVAGSTFVTGDNNTVTVRGITASLPPADKVNAAHELEAELRALLAALQTTDPEGLQEALAAVEKEAAKPEPDKGWISAALERALRIAQTANGIRRTGRGAGAAYRRARLVAGEVRPRGPGHRRDRGVKPAGTTQLASAAPTLSAPTIAISSKSPYLPAQEGRRRR